MNFDRRSNYFVNHSFCLQGIYMFATACIRMGGTCRYDDKRNILDILSRDAVTHVSFLPRVLAKTVEAPPHDYKKPEGLVVTTFGARVSDSLRSRLKLVLGADIIESDSTNASGSICTIHPDGSGTVLPGMQVEVVDARNRPLFGETGRIRVKSAGCIEGYVNDRHATERMFQDGWFYPGDIGIMRTPNSLQLLGQVDDPINFGGIKIDPSVIEDNLQKIVPVRDLCVTSFADIFGNENMCIAVVVDAGTNLEDIRAAIMSGISGSRGHVMIVAVNKIPRTVTGKARRQDLRAAIAQNFADSRQSP